MLLKRFASSVNNTNLPSDCASISKHVVGRRNCARKIDAVQTFCWNLCKAAINDTKSWKGHKTFEGLERLGEHQKAWKKGEYIVPRTLLVVNSSDHKQWLALHMLQINSWQCCSQSVQGACQEGICFEIFEKILLEFLLEKSKIHRSACAWISTN